MNIEEGKYYRTRDGRKVGPMVWGARNPYSKYGWSENPSMSPRWADDGTDCFGVGGWNIAEEWSEDTPATRSPISVTDTDKNGVKHYLSDYPYTISAEIGGLYKEPKLWCYMTPEEKGALLLAHHEGKVIEGWLYGDKWKVLSPEWDQHNAYRIKPEAETVEGWWDGYFHNGEPVRDYYRITFNLIDGEPDTSSIKMETL